MAHDKVYGICDAKCRVEVLPKELAESLAKSITYIELPSGTDLHAVIDDGWYRGNGSQMTNSPTVADFTMLVMRTSEDIVIRVVFPAIMPNPLGSIDPYIYISQYVISEGTGLAWAEICDDKIKLVGTELRMGSATITGAPYYSVDLSPVCSKVLNLNDSTLELKHTDGTVESSVDLSSLGGGSATYICNATDSQSRITGSLRCRHMVVGNLVVLTYTLDGMVVNVDQGISDTNWSSVKASIQEDSTVHRAIDSLVGNTDSIVLCGSVLAMSSGTYGGTHSCRIDRYWGGPDYMSFPKLSGETTLANGSLLYGTLTAVVPIAQ